MITIRHSPHQVKETKQIQKITMMTIKCTTEENISNLGPFDVLCGRDKQSYNNVGNRRFRIMISMNLQKYMKCETRTERSKMILGLIYELSQYCGQLRFLKRVKGSNTLVQLDYKQSREKIAHALRDAASQYRATKRKQTEPERDAENERDTKIQSIPSCKTNIRSTSNTNPSQMVVQNELRASVILFQNEAADVEELSQRGSSGLRLSDIFDDKNHH